MADKLNQEIKIKAKQVTEDLINFMQDLDTENNYQIKELEKDIEYYKSRIEELETENKLAKEIIKELLKTQPPIENVYDIGKFDIDDYGDAIAKAEAFLKE